jgi:hypothetical protein
MTKKMTNDYYQAAGLLLDPNLEWSADLDSIRKPLGAFLKRMAHNGNVHDMHLSALVQELIREENDITI